MNNQDLNTFPTLTPTVQTHVKAKSKWNIRSASFTNLQCIQEWFSNFNPPASLPSRTSPKGMISVRRRSSSRSSAGSYHSPAAKPSAGWPTRTSARRPVARDEPSRCHHRHRHRRPRRHPVRRPGSRAPSSSGLPSFDAGLIVSVWVILIFTRGSSEFWFY